MTDSFRRHTSSLPVVIVLAGLCWFALGCGLFGEGRQETVPTPEPDFEATISAALQNVRAAQQAADPTLTPTAEPIATMAPSPTAPAAATGDQVAALSVVSPDARWGDLFTTFTEAEQSCIRDELGDEQLAAALESSIYHEEETQEWEVAIFDCLGQETAAALYHAFIVAQMGQEVELTAENTACFQDLLVEADVAALVAGSGPDATPAQAEAMFGFFFGLASCIPEMMGAGAGPPSGGDDGALWSHATGGWVSMEPTVVDDVVYAGSADQRVYALDAITGNELWNFATDGAVNSTPAVVDGVVYVGSNDNHLYALDAATGAMLWSHDTGAWVQSTPAVSGGMVYSTALIDGAPRVVALNASSGARVWTAQLPHAPDPEFSLTVAGGLVYVPGTDFGELHALEAATGEIAWTSSVGSGYVRSAPTVLDGVVYQTVVNEAYALDEPTGEVIWRYGTERYPARDFPALVVDGVYYLSPDEFVHALDAATGELRWTYQAMSPVNAAPVVADGRLFAATEGGQVVALDAATGAELWTITTEGTGLQSLTVAEGVLYLESDLGDLMAIDASDGSHVWNIQKGYVSGVRAYTVHEGVVYFGALPSGVRAYAAPGP